MKKVLAGLVALTLAVVALPTAGATVTNDLLAAIDEISAWDPEFAAMAPTAAPASDQQFVAGSQKVTNLAFSGSGEPDPEGGFQHVRVSAHSEADGVDPHGSVRVTFDSPLLPGTTADVKGDVVCLDVVGNQARVGAQLREPHQGNTHVLLRIDDFGNPGPLMGQSPDRVTIAFSTVVDPTICAGTGLILIGEATGNLIVKDDLP